MKDYRFAGKTAVLTGAASGIGEQLAYGLGVRGSDLVLLDRDADRLDAVASTVRLRHPGISVETIVVDLADRKATLAVAEQILADHPRIGLLVNNAGVALGGRFDQVTLDEFEWVMDINFRAPVLLTHTLLPAIAAGGHLVNVSSLYGLIGPAGQSAYSSSKFAIRGLTEVLRAELTPQGIGVTTVHPGGIRTRVAESARVGSGVARTDVEATQKAYRALLSYPAEKAAEEILDGVEHRRARVLIASSAKIPDVLARLLPTSYPRVLDVLTKAMVKRG
ncbi:MULTISPECIES: SDR family NAD(P)-dependent oxidoreductase [unclassified Pseudonocardia]|jgi:short-subunit dehydrogenase|uniref:SDR family NAD(P)-dependent oxidoreductase n=1 Tax=unclassified Pseudonocardia TaxID=2619320 RepID=UPI00095D6C27|nr:MULTISPECIES: SDR family NAD(P)-dependent oxidoreductase [unclassified Pseudonocardia]MBN9103258.1 SDR family NAD(P)-dependent oxidoreductase [Pseudonocardia sp.]OJY50015.1 MAG: acetoin dehydrogenase [Pseudonocardia sp. 73-21]